MIILSKLYTKSNPLLCILIANTVHFACWFIVDHAVDDDNLLRAIIEKFKQ
jgi:hypothetical protein